MIKIRTPLKAALAGLALVAGSVAVGAGVGYASPNVSESAPATTAPATAEPSTTTTVFSAGPETPGVDEGTVECDIEMEALSDDAFADDFDAMDPEEQAALVDAARKAATEVKQRLDDAGVSYTIETDPVTGVEFPTPDPDDPAAQAALEELGAIELDLGGEFEVSVDGDFEEYFNSLDADEQAALVDQQQKDSARLASELDDAGVAYTMEVDSVTGVSWPEPDLNDPAAAEVFAGDCEEEMLTEAEFNEMFNGLSDEEKASIVEQMTAQAAELAEQLDAEGIEYTMEVDPVTGVAWPNGDCDDEASNGSDGAAESSGDGTAAA